MLAAHAEALCLHDGSQLPVTPVLGDLVPSLASEDTAGGAHTYRQANALTHKHKFLKKAVF